MASRDNLIKQFVRKQKTERGQNPYSRVAQAKRQVVRNEMKRTIRHR